MRKDIPVGTPEWEAERIDYCSMHTILVILMRKKLVQSFYKHVVDPTFDELDGKFHFNRINDKFNRWLLNEFVLTLVPDLLDKLESNSIFKMGFMVKSLIDKFLAHTYPPSFLEDIPLEEFFPPQKRYSFKLTEEDISDENVTEMVNELFRLMGQNKNITSIEDLERLSDEQFFDGISGVTDHSQPFINGTRVVSVEDFLKHVLSMPEVFDRFHKLDSNERKIPGVLTVNSHAANLLQQCINVIIEEIINDLVRFQNIFINCIKWDELEEFAK